MARKPQMALKTMILKNDSLKHCFQGELYEI